MKLSTRHKINPHFSMASMTDLVFLLLIFFMLTMASAAPQALHIDLPTSSNTTPLPPQVSVQITADLDYYVDQVQTTQAQLQGLLRQKLNTPQRFVLLQVDKSVPVAHMVYVTDIATSLHAKVAVATQPVTDDGG